MAMLAQLVEQRIVIPWVSGSIPLHRPNEVFGPILWDWLFLFLLSYIAFPVCFARVFANPPVHPVEFLLVPCNCARQAPDLPRQ